MTHEEKQIHNAVHAELREFEEFKELVKQMRKVQNNSAYKYITNCNNFKDLRRLESEVDEYLKKMEV